jgi:hypothetical protein
MQGPATKKGHSQYWSSSLLLARPFWSYSSFMRRWCDKRERFDLYGVLVEVAMSASGTMIRSISTSNAAGCRTLV